MSKTLDLYERTMQIVRLMENRDVRHDVTGKEWTPEAWADLAGKMNRLLRRLRVLGKAEGDQESCEYYWRSTVDKHTYTLGDTLHALATDLFYWSDRWGPERVYAAQKWWELAQELKCQQEQA